MFEITELCLCEQNHLILTPNRLYKFVVDQNCKECLRLQAEGEFMPVNEKGTTDGDIQRLAEQLVTSLFDTDLFKEAGELLPKKEDMLRAFRAPFLKFMDSLSPEQKAMQTQFILLQSEMAKTGVTEKYMEFMFDFMERASSQF